MEEYIEDYGFHFNKKLYEFAVSTMEDRSGKRMQPATKESVENFMKAHGVSLKNNLGYDAAYVFAMAKADYLGSSIPDDYHLALYVKDYLDDVDGAKTRAFDEFYVKTVACGIYIFWDEML